MGWAWFSGWGILVSTGATASRKTTAFIRCRAGVYSRERHILHMGGRLERELMCCEALLCSACCWRACVAMWACGLCEVCEVMG